MTDCQIGRDSIATIKENLRRLEKQIGSPYVRPSDYATRDSLARRLQEAMELKKA